MNFCILKGSIDKWPRLDSITCKKTSLLYEVLSIVLIIFAGTRALGPANDYYNYYNMVVNKDALMLANKELAFRALVNLVDIFGQAKFAVFLTIFAALGVGLKIDAFRKLSPYPLLSIVLYMLSYFWLHEYVQIRAGVATGIFLLSTKDLSEGRTKDYFIKVLLAILFHWSSLVLIPLYFVMRYLSYRSVTMLPIVGIVVYLLRINFSVLVTYVLKKTCINPALYLMYAGYQDYINVFNLISISYLGIYLLVALIARKKNIQFTNYEKVLFEIFCIGIFVFFTTSLLGAPVIAFRLLEYFMIVLIIFLPCLIRKFKEKEYVLLAIVAYYSCYCYYLFRNVIVFDKGV